MLKQRNRANRSTRSSGASQILRASGISTHMRTGSLSPDRDLQRLTLSSVLKPSSIQFGAPSSTGTSSGQSASADLLSQVGKKATSKLTSQLLGGGVLGFVGQSLLAGLGNLFGSSKPQMPALTRFAFPDSKEQALDVASYSGTTVQANATNSPGNQGTYGQHINRNAQVIDAVKQALLTSSQISDIISEL